MSDDAPEMHTRYARLPAGPRTPRPGDVVKVHGVTGTLRDIRVVTDDDILLKSILDVDTRRGDRLVMVRLE